MIITTRKAGAVSFFAAFRWGVRERAERTDDPKADPFLISDGFRFVDGTVEVFVAALDVLVRLFGLRLDLLHRRFLLYDGGVDVLEELRELDHLSFDLLDGFVSALDGVEGGLGLPSSVGLHEL